MSALPRQPVRYARLVLAWFVLTLASAVASPLLGMQSIELVCSANGALKVLIHSADGQGSTLRAHTLDCPLCLTATAPPPAQPAALRPALVPGPAVPRCMAVRVALRTAPPLPARGPPWAAV